MAFVQTKDGTHIYYKDWGSGPAVVFSHGWPLSADAWDSQMLFLASNGFRCIAHDRRGHGRSSQTWSGNDMDTYADDLATLMQTLDLKHAMLVGHSTGGGEVARYIGRHGTSRVAKAVLVSAVPPIMVKSQSNPKGVPMEVFDSIRNNLLADRSQYYEDFSAIFYGANREGAKISKGIRDTFWLISMQVGLKAAYDCVKAFSETDFTGDLKKFDMPTLVIHGEDDQVVPIDTGGRASVKIIKNAKLKEYRGAPHGLTETHKTQLNEDLMGFAREK